MLVCKCVCNSKFFDVLVCFCMLCSVLNVLAHHLLVQFSKSTLLELFLDCAETVDCLIFNSASLVRFPQWSVTCKHAFVLTYCNLNPTLFCCKFYFIKIPLIEFYRLFCRSEPKLFLNHVDRFMQGNSNFSFSPKFTLKKGWHLISKGLWNRQ